MLPARTRDGHGPFGGRQQNWCGHIAHSLLLGTEHGSGLPSPAGAIVVLRHARLLQPLPGRARGLGAGRAVADDVRPRHQGLVVRGVDAGLDAPFLVVQPEAEKSVGTARR